ncbi:tyrosine-type recombinase/integrase [Oricola indica]|uniref:tyrosine-type recombinase/integrase n=1 Tax=Oricola indica TaxID=2872591 RepID=UPI001CBA907F|nr:site-specific integrase [Oricola indica]
MPKQQMTQMWVDRVSVQKPTEFFDTVAQGLALTVGPSGVRTWYAQYTSPVDGKRRRSKLGKHPVMNLRAARGAAGALRSKIAEGEDPVLAEKRAANGDTVGDLLDAYMSSRKFAATGEKHRAEFRRAVERDVLPVIGAVVLSKLSRRDALKPVEMVAKRGAPVAANRLYAYLRAAFAWGESTGHLEVMPLPAKYAEKTKEAPRERVLSDDELRAFWRITGEVGGLTATALRLVLLTAQRSGEVAGMRRSEIDDEAATWTIPSARTKNGLDTLVALGDIARDLIGERLSATNGEYLFPPASGDDDCIKSNVLSQMARKWQAGIEDRWTPHDLRTTAATRMNDLGVEPHVVEAILNHRSGARAGVAGTYNRASYFEQKGEAVRLWERHLKALMQIN